MKADVIIESGSSKSDWIFFNDEGQLAKTEFVGLNPKVIAPEILEGIIKSILEEYKEFEIKNVYFYGAGVLNYENVIENAFIKLINDVHIEVHSDIIAAAKASSYKNKIVCILGTGSVMATFKKEEIQEIRLGHGYIIGDICSGAEFGKIMLRDYLNNDLPSKIQDDLLSNHPEAISNLYQYDFPNKYLASLFPILINNKDTDYVKNLIQNQIKLLINKGLVKLKGNYKKITFVGGVAFQIKDELMDLFSPKFEIEVIEKPAKNLLAHHLKINEN